MADKNIKIQVIDKKATVIGTPVIVCGNSDYTATFTFDDEWSLTGPKTARFVYVKDGKVQHEDVAFSGNVVAVPVLENVDSVDVGVFAGNLCTTTPARVPCRRSILCGSGAKQDPTPDVYDQIMKLFSDLAAAGGFGATEAQARQIEQNKQDIAQLEATKAKQTDVASLASTVGQNSQDIAQLEATKAAQTDMAVLAARMDTFTHLEEGSTTGDAELADIRAGYDGTQYATAGAAVRGQANALAAKIEEEAGQLSSEITEIDEKVLALCKANTEPFDWNKIGTEQFPIGWRGGYYSQITGEISGSANYIRTLVRLSPNNYLTEDIKYLLITPPIGYGVRVFRFNASDSSFLGYVGNYDDIDKPVFMEVSRDCYYTFAVGRFDGNAQDFLTEEFTNNIDLRLIGSNVSLKFKEREVEFTYFNIATTHRESVDCVLSLPSSYQREGKATPIIMFCHGHSGYINNDSWSGNSADLLALVRSFTSNGFAVFDVDNTANASAGNADIGNPKIMESYLKAFEYIKDNYNVESDFYLYSMSFGTFVAMNFLKWYPSKIKTAILSAPRASIRSVYDRGGDYPKEIAEGFGFSDQTGATYESDKVKGYDTTADIITLNDSEYLFKQFPPIKVLMSISDTNNYNEALREVMAIKNGGNVVNLKLMEDLTHHEMCYLMGDGLLEEANAWLNSFK